MAVETPQPRPAPQEGPGRYFIGVGVAVLFGVVGLQLLLLEGPSFEMRAFFGLMGWFSFGMALLAILVMLPRASDQ